MQNPLMQTIEALAKEKLVSELDRRQSQQRADTLKKRMDFETRRLATARQSIDEGVGDRSNADVGNHFDRKGRSQHHACVGAGEVVGQQSQRHRRQSRSGQRDHLCGVQASKGSVF